MSAHARIKVTIWRDQDFRSLTVDAQWLYARLLSDANRNHAGVLALTRRRWAVSAAGMTSERLDTALDELAAGTFIVVDEETEEVLIRTYMRHNEVAAQPNVLKAALRQAADVESLHLRAALAHELRLLPAKPPDTPRMTYPDPHRVADEIDPGPLGARLSVVPAQRDVSADQTTSAKGSAKGSANPSANPLKMEMEMELELVGGCRGELILREEPAPPEPAPPPRPDVEALCVRLHEKLIETDYKPLPKITDQWRTQARLMLDKDERNLDQALRLITWALENDFWSTNIASMGKFRQQYPKLLAAAKREHARQSPQARTGPTRHDQRVLSALALAEKYQREEDAERASLNHRKAIQA